MFQTGGGNSHAKQVASSTGRVMLSALGDLFWGVAGSADGRGGDQLQLLSVAVREARA